MLNKPYTLGLVSGKACSLNESHNSAEMLIMGLYDEFKKLNHVEIKLIDITLEQESNTDSFLKALPLLDFLLVRRYTNSSIVKNILLTKRKVRYQTCSFIEHPQSNFDYCFSFLKYKKTDYHIILPYIKKFMNNIPKTPKTILIDDCYENELDMSNQIIEWIHPLIKEGYKIYQLVENESKLKTGIIPLLKSNYQQYMADTAKIETFIQTHPGSYEHSVIDMAGRGTRVFIPNIDKILKRGFYIPLEIIEDLELPTFKNKDDLISLIQEPVDSIFWNSRIHEMTEMKLIVNIIDNYFQRAIDENNI